jgi:mycoredoxin
MTSKRPSLSLARPHDAGAAWSAEDLHHEAVQNCLATKTVLDRLGVVYDEIDIDEDDESAATVLAINGGYRTVPRLVLPDGRVLVEPTRKALLSEFGPGF